MKAAELYAQLEKDFITPSMSDDWAERMKSVSDFLCGNFKNRSMGLVCDNSTKVNKVYTAVFPSNEVMRSILDRDETDVMLFVHHPMVWDIRKTPNSFQTMDRGLLQQFKETRISIYNLHVPLDNYGEYSTSVSLAKALGIESRKPFGQYFGALAGIFGKSDISTIRELKEKFESIVGHGTSLYQYGTERIEEGVVAVVAGGGNMISMLEDIVRERVNTLLTGITVRNEISKMSHKFAEDNRINILGGTHYSTEKYACKAICEYFMRLELPSEFIEDKPVLEDL